ncbi:fibronectin type III domain-containing protein [Candidatus Falkowbacteria bacterium]|nr:MAG: fibronectin type III domain-containing protein [Candidatus Falkowbacteria bacterium]
MPFIGAQGYTIKYNYEGSNLPPQTIEVGSSLLNYKVQNLIIGENYQFKIIAKKANNQMSNESNSISTIVR